MLKVEKFANSSSIHGIKYVLTSNSSKTKRIFWLIAILFSICGFFYYVHSAYYKLVFEPETAMKASDRNSNDFPAPAITICSNLFAKDNLANVTSVLANAFVKKNEFSKSECEYLVANFQWCNPEQARFISLLCPNHKLDNINIVEMINNSTHSTSDMFNKCINGKCDKDISRVLTDYGFCFTWNSLSFSSMFNTKAIHEDFKGYIKMTDNKQEEKTYWSAESGYKSPKQNFPKRAKKGETFSFEPKIKKTEMDNMCGLSNFKVYLHKPNEVMTPSHLIEYLDLREGMELRVSLKSHQTDRALQKFPPGKRKCYFEGEKKLKYFKSYTKTLCEWECRANLTLKQCGCVKFSYPRDNSSKICGFSMVKCIQSITSVNCNCFPPCIDVEYGYKLLKTQFHMPPQVPDVMARLEISIESEIVIEIENNVSYKLQNFIADFGGLLGLFMGCSLLSIIEILYFLTNSAFSAILNILRSKPPKIWCTKSFQKEITSAQKESKVGPVLSVEVLSTAFYSLATTSKENEKQIQELKKENHKIVQRIEALESKNLLRNN